MTIQKEITAELVELAEGRKEACDWCSTPEHKHAIAERGIMLAEYRVVNTYGVTLGYACAYCFDAPKPEQVPSRSDG